MRRTAAFPAALALGLALLSGCGRGGTATAQGPAATPSAPAGGSATGGSGTGGSCTLPSLGRLIDWEKWPGTPANARLIPDVDATACAYIKDTLASLEPTGPGYCDILARPADNPGYDVGARPAARPQHPLVQAGAGC